MSGLLLDFESCVDIVNKEAHPFVLGMPDFVDLEDLITQSDRFVQFWDTPGPCQGTFFIPMATLWNFVEKIAIDVLLDTERA